MMGLLDSMFGGDPQQQGLLAGYGALLNAGGPSRMPISLGQGFGQALGAGQQAYQQAQEQELQKSYRNAQIAKMKSDSDSKAHQDEILKNALSSDLSDPDNLDRLAVGLAASGHTLAPMVAAKAQRLRVEAAKKSEWQGMQAQDANPGASLMDPTLGADQQTPITIQPTAGRAGVAERFMGPETAQIPGLQQEAMALGNRVQQSPTGDPKTVLAEIAKLDKRVQDYNNTKTASNDRVQAAVDNQKFLREMQQTRLDAPPKAPVIKPPSGYEFGPDAADGSKTLKKMARGPSDQTGGLSEDAIAANAERIASGLKAFDISGRAAVSAMKVQIVNKLVADAKASGTPISEIGSNEATQAGLKKAVSAIESRVAGIELGSKKIEKDIKTIDDYIKPGNLNYPKIVAKAGNSIRSALSDPTLAPYALAVKQVATEYERLMTGGMLSVAQLHVGAQEDAKNILNENMTINEVNAILPVMLREIDNQKSASRETLANLRDQIGDVGKKTSAVNSPPKATMKFNRATGKIEKVQ